jgi:uncharacterized Fe-S center protein
MSKVYYVQIGRAAATGETERAVAALWEAAGLARIFSRGDLAAVKLHVGEPGRKTYLSPDVAAACVRRVAATGARPFLTDTAVLYHSRRDNGPGHVEVAEEHGFGLAAMGAPFLPADGLIGADQVELEVGGKHFEKVAIATGIVQARSVLVLTHATGHLGTGLGGALKNLGMGCSSKKAKLAQHYGHVPRIDADRCIACGECEAECPSGAIAVDEAAVIDAATCIGCGECIAVCREGAVEFDWSIMGDELGERIVEHAAGLARAKPGRIGYVTVAQEITKDCDCLSRVEAPLLADIGILAGHDPVALDQAVLDLVAARAGRSLESMSYPDRDGASQIRYAESLGLGTRDYELVTVTP